MNPKQFLIIGGIVLILVGVLGFVGVIGPTAEQSIFGSAWWFDNAENWAHLVLGVVGVLAVFVLPASLQKPLVMLLGIVAILVALYNLTDKNAMLFGANLESPADLLLHLVVGVWALWASMKKSPMMGSSM
jgi:hypothetical protein